MRRPHSAALKLIAGEIHSFAIAPGDIKRGPSSQNAKVVSVWFANLSGQRTVRLSNYIQAPN